MFLHLGIRFQRGGVQTTEARSQVSALAAEGFSARGGAPGPPTPQGLRILPQISWELDSWQHGPHQRAKKKKTKPKKKSTMLLMSFIPHN